MLLRDGSDLDVWTASDQLLLKHCSGPRPWTKRKLMTSQISILCSRVNELLSVFSQWVWTTTKQINVVAILTFKFDFFKSIEYTKFHVHIFIFIFTIVLPSRRHWRMDYTPNFTFSKISKKKKKNWYRNFLSLPNLSCAYTSYTRGVA